MKKSFFAPCIILTLALVLICGASAYGFLGGKIKKFTADQVYLDPNGEVISSGKIYITPEKIRMDGMPGIEKGQAICVIYHKDEKRQCTFNTQKKLYYEGPLDEEKLMQDLKASSSMSEKAKVLGTEKVSGYKCTKKEVETTMKIMGFTRKHKQKLWVSDRFEMPLRTQLEDGTITELRNIKKGAPSAKYFKTPQGYQRVSNMMAVMGMDFSNMEGDEEEVPQKKDENAGKLPFKIPDSLKNLKLPFGKKN